MHISTTAWCGLVVAALAPLTSLRAQTIVNIPCAADNTLYQSATGDLSNGAGIGIFVGANAFGSIRRAVVRFDVAAALPANAKVLAAELTLNSVQSSAFSAVAMNGHRLLQAWGEGTSVAPPGGGGGGPATANDATWLYRFYNPAAPASSPAWTTPGGDFVGTPSLVGAMPSFGLFTTALSRAAADDVQGWLNNPASNFGWLLKAANETLGSTAHRIDSRESLGTKPSLRVTYVLPGQNAPWGTGCPVGTGFFTAAWVGAPIGGTTVQISKSVAPANSVGADFFTLSLDPLGFPLSPGCTVRLPLAEVVPGNTLLTNGAGTGSTSFAIPLGFPGYLINCQAAVLDNSPLGFVLSNSALTCLQ